MADLHPHYAAKTLHAQGRDDTIEDSIVLEGYTWTSKKSRSIDSASANVSVL